METLREEPHFKFATGTPLRGSVRATRVSLRTIAIGLTLAFLLAGCGSKTQTVAPECGAPREYPAPSADGMFAADAGEDFGFDDAIHAGDRVRLNGTASVHLEGKPLTYHWDQLAGPCVELDLSDPVRPAFKAPYVGTDPTVLLFQLVVSSEGAYSAPDQAEVMVTA